MTSLFYLPKVVSLSGAKMYFTQTGTTTPQDTYQNATLTTPHANPVVADTAGIFAPIFLDPRLPAYRVRLTTSDDVLIYQVDDVPSNQGVQQSMRLESTSPALVWYDTDGTGNQRKFRAIANGNKWELQAGNDPESIWTTFLSIEGGVSQRLQLSTDTTVYDGLTSYALTYLIQDSFTGTLTGYASGPTGTVKYKIVGNDVTMWTEAAIAGTSNATALTMTGVPVICRPSTGREVLCTLIDNSNTAIQGLASVGTGGTITFSVARQDLVSNFIQYGASSFTSSGSKGLPSGWEIRYTKTV